MFLVASPETYHLRVAFTAGALKRMFYLQKHQAALAPGLASRCIGATNTGYELFSVSK